MLAPSRTLCSASAASWWRARWGQGTAESWGEAGQLLPLPASAEPTHGHQKHSNGEGEHWGQGSRELIFHSQQVGVGADSVLDKAQESLSSREQGYAQPTLQTTLQLLFHVLEAMCHR